MDRDWEIIEQVLAGEVNAFEELVHAHKAHVFKIAAAMVEPGQVEEVAHEVFIKAFKDLSGYRRRAPFEHWLARITVRTCHDFWRRRKRDRLRPLSAEDWAFLENRALDQQQLENAAVQRARDLLERVLAHLNPEDRLAFTQLYLEERPMKEVARLLGWSLGRVKIRSFRARRSLRKVLGVVMRG